MDDNEYDYDESEMDEPDIEGLWGIEEEGFDEADFTEEDVTDSFAGLNEDVDTIVATTGINEEVMLINSGDLDFDRNDVGLQSTKVIQLREEQILKIPIRTKYGTIMCDTKCERCPDIGICTKAVDMTISSLGDLSDLGVAPRCRSGYQLMRSRTTGKYKCVRRKTAAKVSKSPFSSFLIFKKKSSDPPLLRAGYSVGNFLFFALFIFALAALVPKVVSIGKTTTDFGIDTWKKYKEVKLIGEK